MIELRQVTKTYRMGDEVIAALDDVDLRVEAGEFVAVVGPSGAGKSTLAHVIGGLDRPDSGAVTVAGTRLDQAKDRALSRYRSETIGFVFQAFNLHPTSTALENVALPLVFTRVPKRERMRRAAECLDAVGLEDRMRHRPSQLSGGQRQRVCIARALANDPPLLIADEPTGNVDSQRGAEIMGLLADLNRERDLTLLVITHDPAIARAADRCIAITDGRLSERRLRKAG